MSLLILTALLVAVPLHAEKLALDFVAQETIMERLRAGLVDTKHRQEAVKNLFTAAGCEATEQKVNRSSGNVICTLPGELEGTIVVGGHFDFITRGKGIVDDWSGTSLLPSLFEALKKQPRRHTFVFVAFAEEETGLYGSSHYVGKLSREQKKQVRAFVNLECLGLSTVKVWSSRATPILLTRLNEAARAIGIALQGVNPDNVGDDDSHPFLSAKIPVISLHSITQDTLPILHSREDSMEAIHPDLYYEAYKLAAVYLAYLDVKTE